MAFIVSRSIRKVMFPTNADQISSSSTTVAQGVMDGREPAKGGVLVLGIP